MTDHRKKMCSNSECIMCKRKKLQKAENDYCPKCGAPLVFVCAKCHTQIEDLGPKHRICELCKIESHEKRAQVGQKAKHVGGAAVKWVGGIATPIVVGFFKNEISGAVKNGLAVAKDIVKDNLIKK